VSRVSSSALGTETDLITALSGLTEVTGLALLLEKEPLSVSSLSFWQLTTRSEAAGGLGRVLAARIALVLREIEAVAVESLLVLGLRELEHRLISRSVG